MRILTTLSLLPFHLNFQSSKEYTVSFLKISQKADPWSPPGPKTSKTQEFGALVVPGDSP